MKKIKGQLKRVLVLTIAMACLIVGLAGLVLPIIQGWFFLALSAILFSMYSPTLRNFLDTRTKPYPKVHAFILKTEEWTTKVFGAPEV